MKRAFFFAVLFFIAAVIVVYWAYQSAFSAKPQQTYECKSEIVSGDDVGQRSRNEDAAVGLGQADRVEVIGEVATGYLAFTVGGIMAAGLPFRTARREMCNGFELVLLGQQWSQVLSDVGEVACDKLGEDDLIWIRLSDYALGIVCVQPQVGQVFDFPPKSDVSVAIHETNSDCVVRFQILSKSMIDIISTPQLRRSLEEDASSWPDRFSIRVPRGIEFQPTAFVSCGGSVGRENTVSEFSLWAGQYQLKVLECSFGWMLADFEFEAETREIILSPVRTRVAKILQHGSARPLRAKLVMRDIIGKSGAAEVPLPLRLSQWGEWELAYSFTATPVPSDRYSVHVTLSDGSSIVTMESPWEELPDLISRVP